MKKINNIFNSQFWQDGVERLIGQEIILNKEDKRVKDWCDYFDH